MVLDKLCLGNRVVDLGAHIGTYTIPFAKSVGIEGAILAVESANASFKLLKENVDRAEVQDIVRCVNATVGDRIRRPLLPKRISGNTGASFHIPSGGDFIQDDQIFMVDTLELLAEYNFLDFEFMKIDVEGMECLVLRSIQELLHERKPVLYIEVAEKQLARFGNNRQDLERLLRIHGYRFYRNVHKRNSNTDEYHIEELPDLISGGEFFDLLAIP